MTFDPEQIAEELTADLSPGRRTDTEPSLPTVQFERASQVTPQPVDWLAPRRIPFSAVTALAGYPGEGKTLMAADMCARFTRGREILGGVHDPGNVVWIGSEESTEHAVVPRLEAMDADLDRVLVCRTAFTMPSGLGALHKAMEESKPGLVILDPLGSSVDPDINANSDFEMRKALAPLALLAATSKAAIVMLVHLNKGSTGGGMAMLRVGGSIGIAGVSRSMLLLAKHPDDPPDTSLRYVAHAKSNFGKKADAAVMQIKSRIGTSWPRLEWQPDRRDVSAEDLLGNGMSQEQREQVVDAEKWARDALLEQGSQTAFQLFQAARAVGFSQGVVRSALRRVPAEFYKDPFKKAWCWRIKVDEPSFAQESEDFPVE